MVERTRVRVRCDYFLSEHDISQGTPGIVVGINPDLETVGNFFRDLTDRAGLICTSDRGPILKRKRPLPEETGSKREQKEVEIPTSPKHTEQKAVANEKKKKKERKRPLPEETGSKREQKEVEEEIKAEFPMANELICEIGNKQVASINNSTSTGFRGAPKVKNVHKACPGNGTQQSLGNQALAVLVHLGHVRDNMVVVLGPAVATLEGEGEGSSGKY